MFHEYNWSTRNKEIKGLGLDKFARGGKKKKSVNEISIDSVSTFDFTKSMESN